MVAQMQVGDAARLHQKQEEGTGFWIFLTVELALLVGMLVG